MSLNVTTSRRSVTSLLPKVNSEMRWSSSTWSSIGICPPTCRPRSPRSNLRLHSLGTVIKRALWAGVKRSHRSFVACRSHFHTAIPCTMSGNFLPHSSWMLRFKTALHRSRSSRICSLSCSLQRLGMPDVFSVSLAVSRSVLSLRYNSTTFHLSPMKMSLLDLAGGASHSPPSKVFLCLLVFFFFKTCLLCQFCLRRFLSCKKEHVYTCMNLFH